MRSANIKFDYEGREIDIEVDFKGNSVCGCGPDDEVPDIENVRGFSSFTHPGPIIESRSVTDEEIEFWLNNDPYMGYIFEAIHEVCQQPDEPYEYERMP